MVQELVDNYKQKFYAYMKFTEDSCSPKKAQKITTTLTSPNYIEDVLIPIFEHLSKNTPEEYGAVSVPNPKTYRSVKEYYRIKVGNYTIGGFLVPDGSSFNVYFVPLKCALPIGKKVKIKNIQQLQKLIIEHSIKK